MRIETGKVACACVRMGCAAPSMNCKTEGRNMKLMMKKWMLVAALGIFPALPNGLCRI